MPAFRPGHGDRVEMGRLDQDRRRRIVDLCACPAHDAGDADGPALVGDQEVLRREGTFFLVQGDHRLAR